MSPQVNMQAATAQGAALGGLYPLEGSEFVLDTDAVIMPIGTTPNPLIRSITPGLDTDKRGCMIPNGNDGLTGRPGVYAGGGAGKCAVAIHQQLLG